MKNKGYGTETAEACRLKAAREEGVPWRRWGPYLSERQWGTVREDYSETEAAWDYFPHDHARSRAYRWGEDGIAGISDENCLVCFAVTVWNGADPILKERLFGLANSEGNHGEDVKEIYYYLDNLPTHAFMRYLYRYPQEAYPYDTIVATNRSRGAKDPEYELIDTGVFANNRYFDVLIEYAKFSPDDIGIRISVTNRGPEEAVLFLLPTVWFRNTWTAIDGSVQGGRPVLRAGTHPDCLVVELEEGSREELSDIERETYRRFLYAESRGQLLFTENDTNNERLFGTPCRTPYVKDAFHRFLCGGEGNAVNTELFGTKAAPLYKISVAPGLTSQVRLRLTPLGPQELPEPLNGIDDLFQLRQRESDEFYQSLFPEDIDSDAGIVFRHSLSGMLWNKQFYHLDANKWLIEHKAHPFLGMNRQVRNREWMHLVNHDIISMPDKWEYPWYAAWDLAFHTSPLGLVDPDFAREQLLLLLSDRYLHPSGQIPAYEWNFGDVNPPVHAWASLFVERMAERRGEEVDIDFLQASFHRLLLNFTWWVNRKDRFGRNVFEGGFLGLDNIGVFDRSAQLPTGGHLEQADGTAWMALFAQNMAEMALEVAEADETYEQMVGKFLEHFLWIAAAINRSGADGMWDEADGFYYDILRCPDGTATRLKVRSLVGLLPLCAVTTVDAVLRERVPTVVEQFRRRLEEMPALREAIHPIEPGYKGRAIIGLLGPERLKRVLKTLLDQNEFLSPFGIRSLSKFHEQNPYRFTTSGREYVVSYLPAESDSNMFGGNSNWRGPIWLPMNVLIIRALIEYYRYYGPSFTIEYPTGSGSVRDLYEVATDIVRRLERIFLLDPETGIRPVFGGEPLFQQDPNWRDYPLFYEYFHGDTGRGLGASHQTGWTGLIAPLILMVRTKTVGEVLERERRSRPMTGV